MTSSWYLAAAGWGCRDFADFSALLLAPALLLLLLYFLSCRGRSTRCLGWRCAWPWRRWGAPRCCTMSTRSSASPRKAFCSSTSHPHRPLEELILVLWYQKRWTNKFMFQIPLLENVKVMIGRTLTDGKITWILVWNESIRAAMLCRAVLKYKAVVLAARHVALSPAACAPQWRACVTPATIINGKTDIFQRSFHKRSGRDQQIWIYWTEWK